MAFTHMVENYKEKSSEFLHLPVEKDDGDGFYQLGDYQVSFCSEEPIVSCLSYTDAIAYYHYFEEDCNLRVQCFDCIRALGLKEMWVFSEMLDDVLGGDNYTLEEAIKEMEDGNDCKCREFVKEEINEDNFESLYHDTFSDLFQEVEHLENKYNVKVLGLRWTIDPITNEKLIRVLKNNKVCYMGKETGKLTEIEPIDSERGEIQQREDIEPIKQQTITNDPKYIVAIINKYQPIDSVPTHVAEKKVVAITSKYLPTDSGKIKIENVPIPENMKDAPEYELQTYLFELALRAYDDRSILNDYNAFVPILTQDEWLVYFGSEEELKPYNQHELLYKVESLFGIGNREEFKTVEEEIWFETAEYICDYINPLLYPEDEDEYLSDES